MAVTDARAPAQWVCRLRADMPCISQERCCGKAGLHVWSQAPAAPTPTCCTPARLVAGSCLFFASSTFQFPVRGNTAAAVAFSGGSWWCEAPLLVLEATSISDTNRFARCSREREILVQSECSAGQSRPWRGTTPRPCRERDRNRGMCSSHVADSIRAIRQAAPSSSVRPGLDTASSNPSSAEHA